ncbi:MAG TPA: hypothetical protein VFO12_09290 [Sphingomicrobium sp.]|nr:hypothetical protein [Sphingomicrobium sp.]
MSLCQFSLGGAAISQSATVEEGKTRTPPKRQTQAKADATVVPEPR